MQVSICLPRTSRLERDWPKELAACNLLSMDRTLNLRGKSLHYEQSSVNMSGRRYISDCCWSEGQNPTGYQHGVLRAEAVIAPRMLLLAKVSSVAGESPAVHERQIKKIQDNN